jgi:hypothetical protein
LPTTGPLETPPGGIPSEPRSALPPPFGSNVRTDAGRTAVIIVERESIRAGKERPVMEALDRFLGRLSSVDRVGLVTVPHGRVEVDLTADKARVRELLPRLTGQAPQDAPGVTQAALDSDKACRSRLTLNTLNGFLQEFSRIDGPKTIIFVSSGLMPPRRDGPMTGPPGQCEIR